MIGNIIGSVGCPPLSNLIGKPRAFLLICSLIVALGTGLAWLLPQGIPMILAFLLTGIVAVGVFPILLTIPIQSPEIGPRYAATAGGVIAMLQQIGAVILPTYVFQTIAGENYTMLFIFGGVSAAVTLFLIMGIKIPKISN
jgi:NNP family nitrate/nitrite transporter-like MFS transporter